MLTYPRMIRLFLLALAALPAWAQPAPLPVEGDWIARDFTFASGETLPELRLHYTTLGKLTGNNAVLILHGTTGHGSRFLAQDFGGVLFGPGQPLDAARYYIILPDAIGHGQSSKPSDGMRARFPRYNYDDMVRAAISPGARRPGRESSAPGDGHVDGRDAHVAVGRNVSRFHGRADAAGQRAGGDRRAESHLPPHDRRLHPHRSGMA